MEFELINSLGNLFTSLLQHCIFFPPSFCQPTNKYLLMLQVYGLLMEKTKDMATMEYNKFCLRIEEKKWTELAAQVRSTLKDHPNSTYFREGRWLTVNQLHSNELLSS